MRKFKDAQEFAHYIKREMAKQFWKDAEKLQKTKFH
jgi:hypothetical protein